MDITNLIEHFENALKNPAEEVRQWKSEQGRRVVGFLMTDVPEELIHAAGFLPYGITGGDSEMEMAETHLQPWVCSYVRNSLSLALGGKLEYLDGLIIPHTCDTTRMLLDLWKHIRPFPYMEDYRLPRQIDRPSAGNYLIKELERIKYGLEQFAGEPIDPDTLKQSIILYNHNRELLRSIVDIHAQDPTMISSRELYTLINGAMVMPRERVNELLIQIVESLDKSSNYEVNGKFLRLLLSGTLLEPFEILDLIDSCGGAVIGDDFQNGYRYIETDVLVRDDIIEALAERQLKRIPSAAFDIKDRPRREFLADLAEEKKAHGVIFLHQSFCEPENFDYYDNLQAMKSAGIPAIRLETQFGRSALGQMRTRIQAFMEMLGGGSQ